MKGFVVVTAALLCGVFVFFVALPIAFSSPYPTVGRRDWAVHVSPVRTERPPSESVVALHRPPVRAALAPPIAAPAVVSVRTVSFRRPEPSEAEVDKPFVTASIGSVPVPASRLARPPAATPPVSVAALPPKPEPAKPGKRNVNIMAEVDAYLWEVYQRSTVKKDRSGDFTWKDPAAAKRMGKTLQAYVIMGMDADFREQLYHAGKAMDEAGIEWTIVSAFRDDWRQSIAAGIKARTGYSRHGGSRAVGGYGHGRAVDVAHADGKSHTAVFRWIDTYGKNYGISRPIAHFDPPHVEPRGDWRKLARELRKERTGVAVVEAPGTDKETKPASKKPKSTRSYRRRRG